FTLIELLTVISIIGVEADILLPALAKSPGRFTLPWKTGRLYTKDKPPDSDTISCDGKGGIRPYFTANTENTPIAVAKDCRKQHEMSHAADVLASDPNICKNKDGTPKPDGTQIYTRSTPRLNASERKAFDVEIDCINKNRDDYEKQ